MLLGHGVGQHEGSGGETHVHTPGSDDGAYEELAPVDLVYGARHDEHGTKGEAREGEHHDGRWTHAVDYQARDEGRHDTAWNDGHEPCRGEQRRSVAEDLGKLPRVVVPNAEAGPSAGYAGENKGHICVEDVEWN